jgi:hypothetical protein
MDGVRCLRCGETRWSLYGGSFEQLLREPCQACGGETVVERRRPGTAARPPRVERRDRAPFEPPSRLVGSGGPPGRGT